MHNSLFLADLRVELATQAHASGIPLEEFEEWVLGHFAQDLGRLPSLGLFCAALTGKHLNLGTNWKPNDLIDMMYLSCATGYADMVVCERHMRDQLERGVRQVGLTTPVFRRITDAVEAIDRILESS